MIRKCMHAEVKIYVDKKQKITEIVAYNLYLKSHNTKVSHSFTSEWSTTNHIIEFSRKVEES